MNINTMIFCKAALKQFVLWKEVYKQMTWQWKMSIGYLRKPQSS